MTVEVKKGRGRPPASLKPDARRIAMKLRWTEEEIEAVRLAAHAAGEDARILYARRHWREAARRPDNSKVSGGAERNPLHRELYQ